MAVDARRDPAIWSRLSGEVKGTSWHLLRMHHQFQQGLIGQGEQITQCCANWTDDLVRQRSWAPEVA